MHKSLLAIPLFVSTQAMAHVGDHTSFDYASLIAHLSEPDHLAMISLAVIAGFYTIRRYRARAAGKAQDHESRGS
jgi:hypothetical protein